MPGIWWYSVVLIFGVLPMSNEIDIFNTIYGVISDDDIAAAKKAIVDISGVKRKDGKTFDISVYVMKDAAELYLAVRAQFTCTKHNVEFTIYGGKIKPNQDAIKDALVRRSAVLVQDYKPFVMPELIDPEPLDEDGVYVPKIGRADIKYYKQGKDWFTWNGTELKKLTTRSKKYYLNKNYVNQLFNEGGIIKLENS